MTKFEKKIDEFKNRGYDVKLRELSYCKEATATKSIKTTSKDPWGNETSTEKADTMIEYTIREYEDGTIEIVKEI